MSYTNGLDKPSDYFNTNLYTGNNTETSHTVGFQPDWTWLKVRNASGSHYWFDAIRGVNNYIRSNRTDAEGTLAETLESFDSDGYTVGTSNAVNTNGETMVGWNWKAGTSFTNDASATGIGTIDSAGSVNQDAGFSICSYTGTGSTGTIKHGLNTAPSMIIVKNRSASQNWVVYHQSLGNTKAIFLSTTGAASTGSDWFNNTSPTSTVFSVGTYDAIVGNGNNLIAYCFAEKKGYSKFGSYTANNSSSDGPYIHLGFKPALFICKKSSGTETWYMNDNKRSSFNPTKAELYASESQAEGTGNARIDLLSNGVKMRTDNGGYNTGSETYIYMAFAEQPFVTSTGVPATAR